MAPHSILLPGESHGRRSLVGCSPWGREESDTTEWLHFHALEKEMATHSSVLAWRIPGMGEPCGPPSMGSHRVGHDWSDLAAAPVFLGGPRMWSNSHIHTGLLEKPELWLYGSLLAKQFYQNCCSLKLIEFNFQVFVKIYPLSSVMDKRGVYTFIQLLFC